MRKHPLIALIAFAFLAIATFVGAAGAGSINSVPVRATSHLGHREADSSTSRLRADNARWLAASAHERADATAFAYVLASERYSTYWQRHAGDLVAVHDSARPSNSQLPSVWRALRFRALRYANARKALAHSYAVAREQAETAEAAAAAAAASAQTVPTTTTTTAPPVTTTTTTTQPPVTTTLPPPTSKGGELGGVWLQLRLCESGDNYSENSGNGYYGAYQFSLSTWESIGYSGLPSDASPAVQDQAAEKLQALAGWGPWPGCSAELGL